MPGPLAWYLEMARLTTRGLTRSRRAGSRLARTWRPMVPVRVGAGHGSGGVGHGGAQDLVGDQEGVDLLVDPGGGAGPQDPPAEDRGFDFQVGGLDLVG